MLVPITFVYLPLFYFVENNHQKDKPSEVSSEQDSDNENIDRNLGDTTDILNMVIYSSNGSIFSNFFAGEAKESELCFRF